MNSTLPRISPASAYGALLLAFVVLVLVFLGLAFQFEYAALQDFSEWVFQAQIFNRLVEGGSSTTFELKPHPVPYALSQWILSGLLMVVPPFLAGKIYILLYFSAFLLTFAFLVRRKSLSPISAALFLISVCALNSCFWNGYAGYQLGLLLFLVYVALQREEQTSPVIVLGFSLLVFFSHGLIFLPFGLTALVFGLMQRKLPQVILALVPVGLLTVWYLVANQKSSSVIVDDVPLTSAAQFIGYKIYTFAKLGPYQNFVISGVDDRAVWRFLPYLGAGINVSFVCCVAVLTLQRLRADGLRSVSQNPNLLVAILLIALMLVLPPQAANIVNPGERLLYPALILLLPFLFFSDATGNHARGGIVVLVAAGLLLTSLSFVTIGQKSVIAARVDAASETSGRNLFPHRLIEFDTKIRETQRAWMANELPQGKLNFDTGLVRNKL